MTGLVLVWPKCIVLRLWSFMRWRRTCWTHWTRTVTFIARWSTWITTRVCFILTWLIGWWAAAYTVSRTVGVIGTCTQRKQRMYQLSQAPQHSSITLSTQQLSSCSSLLTNIIRFCLATATGKVLTCHIVFKQPYCCFQQYSYSFGHTLKVYK